MKLMKQKAQANYGIYNILQSPDTHLTTACSDTSRVPSMSTCSRSGQWSANATRSLSLTVLQPTQIVNN